MTAGSRQPRPSPNFDSRPADRPIDMLILHYTGMQSAEAALERLCDAASRLSAHYLIDEDGSQFALVDESKRAWHAGVARWGGETDINARSIGVELVNPGHEFGYRPFPAAQMESLIALSREILERHPIPPRHVLGHADVAPERKQDPGELFDWPLLAGHGVGLWHDLAFTDRDMERPETPDIAGLQANLARFGYDIAASGRHDDPSRTTVAAFQRHFHRRRWDGVIDWATLEAAARLCRKIG